MTKRKSASPKKKTTTATKAKAPAKRKSLSASEKARNCVSAALDENKAEDIVALDVRDKCSFADYMIVASGRGGRHVSALADYVIKALKKEGFAGMTAEGQEAGDWVLIDTGDVIVHIFKPETRQFYNIEKMWSVAAF